MLKQSYSDSGIRNWGLVGINLTKSANQVLYTLGRKIKRMEATWLGRRVYLILFYLWAMLQVFLFLFTLSQLYHISWSLFGFFFLYTVTEVLFCARFNSNFISFI